MIAAYYLLAGSVLLWFGAETFVGCSSALALRIGLRPLVIGLTVVAFGTSSPELGVSLISSLRDLDGVATGNVVGSNIANIGLILGLAAVIRPIKVEPQLLRLDLPIVVGISFLVTLLFADGVLSRLGGALLLLLLVGYIGLLLRRSRPDVDVETSSIGVQTRKRSLPVIIGLAFFGLGMLVIGSFAFVNGAEDMALGLGVSPAVVGLTVVAIGTSLPEAATSVAAAWRGQGDIAVGNVVGSNVFNLLAILGITAVIRPISRGDVSMVSFGIMIALALLLLPVMRTGFRISRLEGAGLLASYAGYLYWLVP
jgi:cation:H+ antiporter